MSDATVIGEPTARPRLLGLFDGAGGAAVGYHRAGFDVVGVDIAPQPNYPFKMLARDAMSLIEHMEFLRSFAAIHASPPCQRYSALALRNGNAEQHPDYIGVLRWQLQRAGVPYVIENVPGAPLHDPVALCGTMFPGLRVIRHRLFETNWGLAPPPEHPKHPLVFTHDKRKAHYGQLDQNTAFVQVTGGGNATLANKLDAMGIDWMTSHHEVNEAVPPAYTEWVGRQLLEKLERN